MSATLDAFAQVRGFRVDFLRKYGFEAAPEGETPFPEEWIKFPYPSLTGIHTHRYRRPPLLDDSDYPKYWAPKGTGQHLYNPLLLGPHSSEVWLVEGELDALTLITYDVPAIGIPGTQGFKQTWKYLFSEATVFIAFDNDDAGRKGASQLKSILPHAHVLEVPFDGDFNDWMKYDPDYLEDWLYHV